MKNLNVYKCVLISYLLPSQMVKLMVKRGLVSDIAKIPHSLDLSNPATVNTINALLKPLETLSRIVNQPQLGPAGVTGNRPALTR